MNGIVFYLKFPFGNASTGSASIGNADTELVKEIYLSVLNKKSFL